MTQKQTDELVAVIHALDARLDALEQSVTIISQTDMENIIIRAPETKSWAKILKHNLESYNRTHKRFMLAFKAGNVTEGN